MPLRTILFRIYITLQLTFPREVSGTHAFYGTATGALARSARSLIVLDPGVRQSNQLRIAHYVRPFIDH